MATITGSGSGDIITPFFISGGVAGGPVTPLGDSISGLGGPDAIDGGGGNDTLLGGAGSDTLFGNAGADTLTGGGAADLFELARFFTTTPPFSSFAEMDRVTDFRPTADGDRLGFGAEGLGDAQLRYLVFAGNLAPVAALTAGLALPDLPGGPDEAELYWVPDIAGTGGWVLIDQNGNFVLDAADFAARIDITDGTSSAAFDPLWTEPVSLALIGTAGNDTLNAGAVGYLLDGGAGNDSLLGGLNDDQLFGGDGDDIAQAAEGDDFVSGDAGNDTLEGGTGEDVLDGGDGNDVLRGGAGADELAGGSGADAADYGSAAAGIVGNLTTGVATDGLGGTDTLDSIERIWGGTGNDSLTGSSIPTVPGFYGLFGNAGNDTINGLGFVWNNADHFGEAGAIRVNLSAGALTLGGVLLAAGTGQDASGGINTFQNVLAASGSNIGNDILQGGAAGEWLIGNGGNDTIDGGGGNDTLAGGTGNDSLLGAEGNDSAFGDSGNDVIEGGIGNDSLFGQDGQDSVTGGDGADSIDGGTGNDTLLGGEGNDTLLTGAVSETGDFADGGIGDDDVRGRTTGSFGGSFVYLVGGAGNDTLRGYGVFDNIADYRAETTGIVAVLGGAGLGSVTVGGGTDLLDNIIHIAGGSGADSITGSAASESFLLGAGGADTVAGGNGTDRLEYHNWRPTPDALTGAGVTVDMLAGQATIGGAVQLFSSMENLAGSDFDDMVLGTDGDNDIRPIAGNDTVDGRGGYDTVRYTTTGFVYGSTPPAGVVIDLQAGTGTDPWGFTDTFANVEAVTGTVVADDLTGRINPDFTNSNVRGLQGNDTLRAPGLDTRVVADYREDPGTVRVNLSAADAMLAGQLVLARTGRDGWGFTDSYDKIQGVLGSNSSDAILGSERGDRLYGWVGNDTLQGGAGDDTLGGGQGADLFDGGAGFDLITFERYAASEAPPTQGVVASLLTGIIANDGYGTAESIAGGAANTIEMLIGHTFNDNLTGRVIAELSADGSRQQSYLRGNQGNDTLQGVAGEGRWITTDHLRDADANGDGFGVTVNLATQTATDGWGGTDTLVNIGAARGSAFADSLIGTDGDNWFRGEAGEDTIIGGLGFDFLSHGDSTNSVILDLESGVVTDDGWGSTDSASGFEGASGGSGDDTLRGSTAANLLNAFGGNDLLEGRAGNDTLNGFGGNDTIDGGAGLDSLVGGTGNDRYVVDNAGDTIAELADEGTDTVQAGITWTLGDNLEALVLTGTARNGTGNALDNLLTGTGARNVLNGDAGNDTLEGGAGGDQLDGGTGADSLVGGANNDTYLVDNLGDVIVELAGGGADTVRASVSWTLGDQIEDLVLLSGAIAGTGNALNNVIEGNGAANRLEGLGGRDLLLGNAGNDTLLGGEGPDTLEGGGGRDSMEGGSNTDLFRWALASHGRDTISGFNAAQDDLAFSAAGFGGGLVAGVALTAAQFESNATGAASTADARFVYNTLSGVLFYDADGSGAGTAAEIATFVGAPALGPGDIVIIA